MKALFICSVAFGSFTPSSADCPKIPVDLWTVGDDNLTQIFSKSLREAVLQSTYFELKNDEAVGNAEITIDNNVSSIDIKNNIVGFKYRVSLKYSCIRSSFNGECSLKYIQSCSKDILNSIINETSKKCE